MGSEQGAAVESCAYDDCEREVDDGKRCYWHREQGGKCPEEDLELGDGFPVDMAGAYLQEADLSEAVLGNPLVSRTPADLSDADLSYADLSDADLSSADLSDADLSSADLTNAGLRSADLTNADLLFADLTDANPISANFTNANLWQADLTDVNLDSADLTDADLSSVDLTNADLIDADLTDAGLCLVDLTNTDLRDADLTNADLRHATLHKTDLGETKITNLTLDRETTITDLPEPNDNTTEQTEEEQDVTDDESDEPDVEPKDWDEVARVYHALKKEFDANGFVTRARRFHRLERRARRHETRVEDGWFSRAHLAEFASGAITGYGVGVKRIAGVATFLFALSTATYALASVENPVIYSAITFATAPPYGVRDLPLLARLIAGVETIFGTLLLITLGFVLSNREQF